MKGQPLTAERARELLDYDPVRGVLVWRIDVRASYRKTGRLLAKAGAVAGRLMKAKGRWQLKIDGKHYYRSRVVWLWVTGAWPSKQIDHENTDCADDRFENLREATMAQNQANRRKMRHGDCPYKGVSYRKRERKWVASVRSNGVVHHLGGFKTAEEASHAYQLAARKYQGEYARET